MRTPIKILLNTAPVDTEATVAGWLRTRRDSKGGFSFLELNDGSCFANLQIVAPGELPNYANEVQTGEGLARAMAEGLVYAMANPMVYALVYATAESMAPYCCAFSERCAGWLRR